MNRLAQSAVMLVGAVTCAGSTLVCEAVEPSFNNQTAAAGVVTAHSTSGFDQSSYAAGGSVGDFNNDGFQDFFVCKGGSGSAADRLYINNGDGTFTNQAATWGLTAAHKGKGTAVGDFNNDGWLDIMVLSAGPNNMPAQVGHHKLYRNNGNNTFTDIAASAGVQTVNPNAPDAWAAAFGDYDLDGDLDLFIGGFSTGSPSNNGNRLYRNNGNETFTNVTATIGLFTGVPPTATLSASFADMNGDRYPELLLGGDFEGSGSFGGSRYFRNNGNGSFSDITNASNTGLEENGMGHTLGDFNNDSKLDWYVTSIYAPGGFWTGNKLYRNSGGHLYVEHSGTAGVFDGGYGWGTIAVDVNNDGWVDIAETNGDGSAGGQFFNEQSYLWTNDGDLTFTEKAIASGFSHFGKGRGLYHFDYDNDGDQDMLLMANNEQMNLFRNTLPAGPSTHYLRVFLDTSDAPGLAPNGYGSLLLATAGGVTRMRHINGGNSYLGINELSAHFGLGSATVVDELRITWADGTEKVLQNVAVDQTITVSPSTPCESDVNGSGQVDIDDLFDLIGAWGTADPTFDLNASGKVDIDDLFMIIAAWGPCL